MRAKQRRQAVDSEFKLSYRAMSNLMIDMCKGYACFNVNPGLYIARIPREVLHASTTQYASFVGNTESDLSSFKAHGGNMITWHGLADEAIPPKGTIKYYEEVLEKDPEAHNFYRFFEAPGVAHCYGGLGPIPNGAMSQLVAWVEDDDAPATLHATAGQNNTARDLCPYPLQQKYIGRDPRKPASFTCARKA